MKKIYIFMVLLLAAAVLFTGCSASGINANVNQNAEEYIPNEDYQNFIRIPFMVKTDKGYYFCSGFKLFFYDAEEKQVYPACSKPNCAHTDSKCSAYLSPQKYWSLMPISCYDNSVYVLGREKDGAGKSGNYLYQINTDNFKHRKAAFLFDTEGEVSLVYIIHRGYVYFTNDGGIMKETTATLYRTKLGETGNDAPEKIYEFNGIGANIHGLSAYGNTVFFTASSYADEKGNGYKSVLNSMDIHTLESTEIPGVEYSYFADGSKIYYEPNETDVTCLDLKTGKESLFCNIDGPCYISADSNYIYFDNRQKRSIDKGLTDRRILVYDKSGKYITEIVPRNPDDDCYFGGDDIMIFKEIIVGETITDSSAENDVKGYYVLDKSQLTSPDKQFIDME